MFFPALVFLADHRSGLAIFEVLSLSSLVGLTIGPFIRGKIINVFLRKYCSYAKIVGKNCMYVLYPLNQAFVKLIHGELASLPLD